MRELPRADGSARFRARELRRHRPLAHHERGEHADRRVGRAARRHEVRRSRRAAPAAGQPARRVRPDGDRETARLRPRPRPRVLRHADGPPYSAGRRGRRLPLVGTHLKRSSKALLFRCGGRNHDRHQEDRRPPDRAARTRSGHVSSAARRHGAGAHRAGADAGQVARALRRRLRPDGRGDEQLDARGNRRRLRAQPDPRAARHSSAIAWSC